MLRRAPGALFGEICLAALPFMCCALLLTLLIVIFPDLAVWLPWLGGRPGGASWRRARDVASCPFVVMECRIADRIMTYGACAGAWR